MMITVNIQSTSVICTCSQSVIVQGHFGLWKQVATPFIHRWHAVQRCCNFIGLREPRGLQRLHSAITLHYIMPQQGASPHFYGWRRSKLFQGHQCNYLVWFVFCFCFSFSSRRELKQNSGGRRRQNNKTNYRRQKAHVNM